MSTQRLIYSLLAVWVLTPSLAMSQVFFQGLGDLPGGEVSSHPSGISEDGQVVVGSSWSGDGTQAFRWTSEGGMVGLGFISGETPFSSATATSHQGWIVVGRATSPESSPNTEPFRWTQEGGMIGLGDFPGGSTNGWASGVSGDGLIVVGSSSGEEGGQAFRWTETDGMVGLGFLPGGRGSGARGISTDGQTIVGVGNSSEGPQAFRWTAEQGMVGLGDLPGGDFVSDALGVSADGLVIVGFSESENGDEAFRWTIEEGMMGLGDLPEGLFRSVATAVSADGSIVVGSSCLSPGPLCFDVAPFIWDAEHGMRNLRDVLADGYGLALGGWTLGAARGVSADGLSIIGNGANPNGDSEGWIVRLPDCNGNGQADDLDILDGISTDGNGNYIPDECEDDCNGNGQDDADDVEDGTSEDCNDNAIPDECEADCNGNGQQDTCDIDQGVSEDCDSNRIPDECVDPEDDCNSSQTPDDCDIADGSSTDCDLDGLPDECQIEIDSVPGGPFYCDPMVQECDPDCNANGVPDFCDIADGFSEDCNDNGVPDECDIDQDSPVPGGPFYCDPTVQDCDPDCNANGIPDFCDIADGTSTDCDGSAVPDECEEWADCNGNGELDSCDIADGTSADCNLNDVPDECEVPLPIIEQPEDQQVEEGDFVWFFVEADGFLLDYQWRKDGVDLLDTDRILGSATATLLILEVQPSDAGEYDCVITDLFGCENTSDPATLTVHGPCPVDFDGNGAVGPFDLAILLGNWGPAPNHPADLDADGTVGPADLALLLGSWGPCS